MFKQQLSAGAASVVAPVVAQTASLAPLGRRINDAAVAIGVCRSSVYELISEGKLEAVKIAGRTIVTERSLRALVGDEPEIKAA